jgi:ABC-type multidrug transport system fused ATPase/permease subunit
LGYSCQDANIGDVIKAAKLSGAHEFISQLPNGYDTQSGELGKKLSGGERQKISIARSILKHPEIVIFDEPTTHLDSIAADSIIGSIQKVFKGKTYIIISHFLKNINWVDRTIVLKDGRILQEGTHDILVRGSGHYKELFGITDDTCPKFRT